MSRKNRIMLLGAIAVVLALAAGGLWAYSRGYYHALRGGMAQSDNNLDAAIAYFTVAYGKNPDTFMVAHDLACCYALKGDNASCFHWLRLALKTSYADYAKQYAKQERDFDAVRQTPEFQSLIYDRPR
jgi:tetratricopeptide (TPR) repeat protein